MRHRPPVLQGYYCGAGYVVLSFSTLWIVGAKWAKQIDHGLPITGVLSQKGAYHVDASVKLDLIRPQKLADSAFGRFKKMATRAMPNRDSELRGAACEQSEKGRPPQPRPVDESASTYPFKRQGFNSAFWFAVIQGDKVRACDDLRRPLTDRACSVLAPH